MPTLGNLLREARIKAGLNQPQASKASGIAQGNISEYEADKKAPNFAIVQRLAEAYKTTVSKLTRNLD